MVSEPSVSGTKSAEEAKLPLMSVYVFGLLRRVPDRPKLSDEETETIQEGHLAHLRRMTEQGDLIVAGPLMEDGDIRGVLIFKSDSLELVQRLSQGDPAIQRKRLMPELHQLFAPAGLRVISPDRESPT